MNVGVVGCGAMGLGVTELLLVADHSVFLVTRTEDRARDCRTKIESAMNWYWEKKRKSKEVVDAALRRLTITADYSILSSVDFVVECVSEDMEIKRSVIEKIGAYISPECVLATNTSSLSIAALAKSFADPRRVLGFHLFNPPKTMKLVEVIKGPLTGQPAVDRGIELARSLGKEPVTIDDSPGFIVNKLLIPMINEAVGLLSTGVATKEDLDKAMRLGANHPMGPLELADLIGTDLCLSILESLYTETGNQKYAPDPLLKKMVRENRLGRKTKSGFYTYE
jgi:3-hydroxybutyryl-CoA dehydrogenase